MSVKIEVIENDSEYSPLSDFGSDSDDIEPIKDTEQVFISSNWTILRPKV